MDGKERATRLVNFLMGAMAAMGGNEDIRRRPCGGGWLRRASLSTAVVLTVCMTGCSSNKPKLPPLAPVSGTITMDGKPLAGVQVLFMSPTGYASSGVTDKDGKYDLQFRHFGPGAGPGRNTVMVTNSPADPSIPIESMPPEKRPQPIPDVYNSKTTLTAEVEPSKSNTFDFQLKSRP